MNKCKDCGGEKSRKANNYCRKCWFLNHNSKGFKRSQEFVKQARISKLGEKNPNWKGDKVGIKSLHDWIRYRKPRPHMCERCKERPAIDLANVSGKYRRDVNDFEWLCRKCHMGLDGRIEKFIERNRNVSEETRKKLSESLKGRTSWIKGKHQTTETKRKISESKKGKKYPCRTGENHHWWKGGVKNPKISRTHFNRLKKAGSAKNGQSFKTEKGKGDFML